MGEKYPVRNPYQVTLSASGTGTLATDRVKPGERLTCQSIAFRNRTGARGTASLRIRSSAVVYDLGDQASPVANQWYYYPYEQHLGESEQIEVSQASCSASDVLDLVVIGYLEFSQASGGG